MTVLRCDVTHADDVVAAFKNMAIEVCDGENFPPVRGIIHAACPNQQLVEVSEDEKGGKGRVVRGGKDHGFDVDQSVFDAKVRGGSRSRSVIVGS